MNHNDLSSKLAQVIEQIPRDVLYDFCCSYAEEHEELAMALVNEYWRAENVDVLVILNSIIIPAQRWSRCCWLEKPEKDLYK